MAHGRACSSRPPKSAVSLYQQPWHRLTQRRDRSVPEQRVRLAAVVEPERGVARFGWCPIGTHRRQPYERADRRGARAAHHLHGVCAWFCGRRNSKSLYLRTTSSARRAARERIVQRHLTDNWHSETFGVRGRAGELQHRQASALHEGYAKGLSAKRVVQLTLGLPRRCARKLQRPPGRSRQH